MKFILSHVPFIFKPYSENGIKIYGFLMKLHTKKIQSLVPFISGRPFVKWFALCYRTVVLSVCL